MILLYNSMHPPPASGAAPPPAAAVVVVAVVVVVVVVEVVVVSRQAELLDQAPKPVHPSPWIKSYYSSAVFTNSRFNLAEFHDGIPDKSSSSSC